MPKATESTIMDTSNKKSRKKEKKKKIKKRKRTKDLDEVSPSPEGKKTSSSFGAVAKGQAEERSVTIPEQVAATNPNPVAKKRKKKRKKDRRVKNSAAAAAAAKEQIEDSTAPSFAVKQESEKVQGKNDTCHTADPFVLVFAPQMLLGVIFSIFSTTHVSKPNLYSNFHNTNRSINVPDLHKK